MSSQPRRPAADTPLTLAPHEGPVAGRAAVISSLKTSLAEMGLVRTVQTLSRVNQTDGFDCPGCAWPDPKERSAVEFCENGARAVAHEATLRRITSDFFAQHPISDLLTRTDHWLEARGRLTEPLVRAPGADHYTPCTWDEAFERIARTLNELESPHEAVFYTSGRTSNEAAFLYQLFVRQLGTNNLPDCSNLCHESSGTGLGETLGVGKGTVSLEDFAQADAIFILGQNPGTNHPRMLTTLQAAARRGCRIVSINPLREASLQSFAHPQTASGLLNIGSPIAERIVQVRINGDVALLKGMMKALLEGEAKAPGEVLDHAFIENHTVGFEAFRDGILAADWTQLERISGVSRPDMEDLALLYRRADRVIACWAMGLTQHKNGVANVQEVVNLLLLRGNVGRPGAGVCPVRGHSNVQGDRTMGIHERPRPEFLDRLEQVFAFAPPRAPGYSTVEAIQAMHEGRVKVLVALGGNFHSASPDTRYTEAALQRLALSVHISTKLNRSHLITGREALILPCLGRTEQDLQQGRPQLVSVENSMGNVQASRGNLPPASSQLLSEPTIVARLAQATLGNRSSVPWLELVADYDRIRTRIEQVVTGFTDYNRRLREPGGFVLPNGARERRFLTSSGKAHFTVHPVEERILAPDQLLMMTIRTHDQYNTTVYDLNDRYRGIYRERRVVLANAADLEARGLIEGQSVDLISYFEGEERRAEGFYAVSYDIPRGCVATYFPEANVLIPVRSFADRSKTPTSKSVVVRLFPAGQSEAAHVQRV